MGEKEDFLIIFEEIRRQFDLIIKIDYSHDSKIGVFLGSCGQSLWNLAQSFH